MKGKVLARTSAILGSCRTLAAACRTSCETAASPNVAPNSEASTWPARQTSRVARNMAADSSASELGPHQRWGQRREAETVEGNCRGQVAANKPVGDGWERASAGAATNAAEVAVSVFPNETGAGRRRPFALSEMRRPLVAVELASLIQLVALLSPRQDFHPLLDAPLNLPGVRLRLFPSGVSYIAQVLSDADLLAFLRTGTSEGTYSWYSAPAYGGCLY